MHGAPVGLMNYLTISEIFGPTLQGEGPSQGRPVAFLRLGLCNLDCAWCDTPYTWDWTGKNGVVYDKATELRRLTIDEVVEQVCAIGVSRLVVTGGEPLIQAKGLAVLADILYDEKGMSIEIETNGTLPLPETLMAKGIGVNCSPKLTNSDIPAQKRINAHVLRDLSAYGAAFKFVVKGKDDISEVEQIVSLAGVKPSQVWLMPEGTHRDVILFRLPELFDICSERGWSLAPRLHVLAHGDKRGI